MRHLYNNISIEKIISRQVALWETARTKVPAEPQPATKPCITISREMGCPGVALAESLSEALGWRVYDKNIVEHIAENAKVQQHLIDSFDEKGQNEVHNWVLTLLDRYAVGSDKYFKHLVTVITGIGKHGEAVIVGRGGHFILAPETTLRLRLFAPFAARVENIMRNHKVGKAQAESMVNNDDRNQTAFMQRFFHKGEDIATNFDLVINTETLSLTTIKSIVLNALKEQFPHWYSSSHT